MKIKFRIDITAPAAQVGTAGEVKDVDDRAANILIKGGYADEVKDVAEHPADRGGKIPKER